MTVNLRHLEILYGTMGAREKFEEMAGHLVRSQHPNAERVRIVRGDGGIDAHDGGLADPAGVDVFQMKFFPVGIDESQRGQIRDSFKRARDSKDFKTKSWTLCIPIDMSIEEKKWFDDWVTKQAGSGIDIRPVWGAMTIERLLMQKENQDIRETYFQEEHLQHARAMSGHLQKLVEEFVGRVPKPEPTVLEATLDAVKARNCYRFDGEHVIAEIQLCFTVRNTSDNQTSKGWSVQGELSLPPDVCYTRKTFPRIGSGNSYMRLDNTLLPQSEVTTELLFGLKINQHQSLSLRRLLEPQFRTLLEPAVLKYRVISDNHTGPFAEVLVREKIDWEPLMVGVENAYLLATGGRS